MLPQRIIAHFDLDSFFVSVEMLHDPSLKEKPVIVGGGDRGVVAACSYEARKFGIHSAMPSARARQLCPHAIYIKGNHAAYSHYSRQVTQIIASRAPLFEKASIDEFYLDLTGMDRFHNPLQWTLDLRHYIMAETGLPISFGLSGNKMMAKIATNQAKPNGYLQVPYGQEANFLSPLPVDAIPGVGEQTREILKSLKLYKISDLVRAGEELLEERLGKWGKDLWRKSQGIHDSPVTPYHEAKSVSSENTFDENKTDMNFLNAELVRLTEKICFELRQDKQVAGCIAVKIRYPDFTTSTRQITVPYTCNDDEIIPVVKLMFNKLYKKNTPVRLLGVRLGELTQEAVQGGLFSDTAKKTELYNAIDGVKNRFGKSFVRRASSNK